jgi:hypothetical protein
LNDLSEVFEGTDESVQPQLVVEHTDLTAGMALAICTVSSTVESFHGLEQLVYKQNLSNYLAKKNI